VQQRRDRRQRKPGACASVRPINSLTSAGCSALPEIWMSCHPGGLLVQRLLLALSCPRTLSVVPRNAGWMRMCLQVLFFAPVNLLEPESSFRRFAGRLIVSPVVRVLVFSKVRTAAMMHMDAWMHRWSLNPKP